ncbi:beta/gamma crystallin domain-containing protein 1 [Carettochelys insculpta]|uniref:beta/gamma crystallin domain-containing protein 1 n=1 Tax=Carettochelys insculpta TaxID=44489 RepID=UPI003EBD114A
MEKRGFKRLGKLFHWSESEDSEPETPSPQRQREPKKRSAFSHWRLRKQQQQHLGEGDGGLFHSPAPAPCAAAEPGICTVRCSNIPDKHCVAQESQLSSIPYPDPQSSETPSTISLATIALSTMTRKSKTQSPESSKEENKKKPVFGKLGNLFSTGKKKNARNSLEPSTSPNIESGTLVSAHKDTASLKSIDNEHTKKEECRAPQLKEARSWNDLTETHEYCEEITPLSHDIITEWSSREACSDIEWSPNWNSSNETIKNTFSENDLTVETLELKQDPVVDISNSTTPDFIKSLNNLSSEDSEKNLLNHKPLVSVEGSTQPVCVASKELPHCLESKSAEHVHPARVLTLDIYLSKIEDTPLNESVTLSGEVCGDTDTMDKKSVTRRSGKRRKSQSSSETLNGEGNQSENTAKDDAGFGGSVSSNVVSEKITNAEKKNKSPQQTPERNSSTFSNQDLKIGSNHKGLPKTESDKCKQQVPTSSSFRRRSKKNQSDAVPASPTGLKNPIKDSLSKKQFVQPVAATEGSPTTKTTSVEKGAVPTPCGETNTGTSKVSSADDPENTTLLSESKTESKNAKHINSSEEQAFLRTERIENGELGRSIDKEASSDLDSTKLRNLCLDVSRSTVTTKISLPAKPKNVELNFKTPKSPEHLKGEHDSLEKPASKINSRIANKISLFENKQANQRQRPTDVPVLKNNAISNTFVGRAKLKFGKQPQEYEQTDKIINKQSNHQKLSNNVSRVKEGSAEVKAKPEENSLAGTSVNEVEKAVELTEGKVSGSPFNQISEVDAYACSLRQADVELNTVTKDSLSPVTSLQHSNKNEILKDNGNRAINGSEEKLVSNTEISSPCKDVKGPLKPDVVSKESEQNILTQIQNEGKTTETGKQISANVQCNNGDLENIQRLEQNIVSMQQSPSNTGNMFPDNDECVSDSPSDMKKFTETIKNLDSSVCLPQKKRPKLPKSPAPHFAMPPIHEDNLEKVLDPTVFTLGLGIKRGKTQDLAPSLQLKMHNRDSTEGEIKRSRLEKSAVFSSLLSSTTKEKVFTPSVTSVNTITTAFATECSGMPAVLFNAAPPLDIPQNSESLSGLKVPSCMEKYLQTDELNSQMPNGGRSDKNFLSWPKSSPYETNIPSGFLDGEASSGNRQNKINPRPGKMVIYGDSNTQKNGIEVFNDVLDCNSWVMSSEVFVKVVRGCWILFKKPNFEGPCIPLEEEELELVNIWDENTSEERDEYKSAKPAVIGSIKHVVKDYRICQIDLYTGTDGMGIINSFFDDTEETGVFGTTQKTCSIKVHWGIWLIYEEPGFQGTPLMLEPGEYPNLAFWEKKEAYIRSLRPLKMGGRKVESTEEPKVIVYEKPFFTGQHVKLDSEILCLTEEEKQNDDSGENKALPFSSVGSIKVLEGVWVAYEKPGFAGHQYLLEEGEYQEWKDWGGYSGELQSLRPVISAFTNPHMMMYSEKDFGTKGPSINVLGIISNLRDTGYGLRTQSIHVLSGVWVVYENPDFTGEQYILDKGLYPNVESWGGKNNKISSVQPIVVDTTKSRMGKFKVQLFSEPEFKGDSQIFEKNTNCIDESFATKSSKVLGGSWIAYDKEDFCGNQYVLEEGTYPNLSAMGCPPETRLKSLQVINIELSEPSIALFEKEDLKGKKMEFTTEVLNLQFLGYNPQIASVQVAGGMWIIYEYSNYRGRQILLSPKQIPDWHKLSGCHQIGSLRPLLQKRVYFRLRNKETGKFMSTDGNVDDLSLLRIQVAEDSKSDDQIWVYQDGFIKCRMAEDCCLTIVGNLITPGSKIGLSIEENEDKQYWCVNPDGRIHSKMKPTLVLDIKGGTQYDQNCVVVNTFNEQKLSQCWEALLL